MMTLHELDILIRARYPLVYLVTPEEDRALAAISQMIEAQTFKPLYVWAVTQGFRQFNRAGQQAVPGQTSQFGQTIPGTISPEAALDFATKRTDPTIFV